MILKTHFLGLYEQINAKGLPIFPSFLLWSSYLKVRALNLNTVFSRCHFLGVLGAENYWPIVFPSVHKLLLHACTLYLQYCKSSKVYINYFTFDDIFVPFIECEAERYTGESKSYFFYTQCVS